MILTVTLRVADISRTTIFYLRSSIKIVRRTCKVMPNVMATYLYLRNTVRSFLKKKGRATWCRRTTNSVYSTAPAMWLCPWSSTMYYRAIKIRCPHPSTSPYLPKKMKNGDTIPGEGQHFRCVSKPTSLLYNLRRRINPHCPLPFARRRPGAERPPRSRRHPRW